MMNAEVTEQTVTYRDMVVDRSTHASVANGMQYSNISNIWSYVNSRKRAKLFVVFLIIQYCSSVFAELPVNVGTIRDV